MKHSLTQPLCALTLLTGLSACAGPISTYKFPEREYKPGAYASDGAEENGLLWGPQTPSVVEDYRGRRLGDIVVVRVEEQADASEQAGTQTSTKSGVKVGLSNFFGAVEKLGKKHPNLDETALVQALYESSYQGDGKTNRSGNLSATIPCQVKQVLPNGDLFIEGGKTIQINREETHLYMSGVVRPYDVGMDNTVSSQRILDARIDFSGRGVVSDKQGPGLLHRGMDKIWPF